MHKPEMLTRSTDLSAAVDVYADWVDACDTVANTGGGGTERFAASESRPQPPRPQKNQDNEDEDAEDGPGGYAEAGDNFIDDEDDAGHADYED
ncbi:MAG: hypothetical protein M1814_002811 [Vezdaea aestivalis]|nr:MAG: hypothetical protein M1814_002811 [Vezdaea aestivalis]